MNESRVGTPLRLWPGVVIVALQWLVRFAIPLVVPAFAGTAVLGGLAGAAGVVVWWLFFSRAPWLDRVGAIVAMAAALAVTSRLVHTSIANGMMGFMLPIYAAPLLSLALVAGAAASLRLPRELGRAAIAASIGIACAALTLVRTGGMTGDAVSDLHWRWTSAPEERLLASASQAPVAGAADAVAASSDATVAGGEWPGFRGADRDGIVRGTSIATDWKTSPPVQLWRRPVGPGWSSFAVHGKRFYTQEQRGQEEIVSSYDLATGTPLWQHGDAARFWESNGGAGPRATPTVSGDRVYSFGATGVLNALDASNGAVVWSRNAATDTKRKVPEWGLSSSPLVIEDAVVVAVDGLLAAYDLATGQPRWTGPPKGWGYSSPQRASIDGVEQIVLSNGEGAIGVAPADGKLLWRHEWSGDGIVQPAVLADGNVLIGSGSGLAAAMGLRRVAVTNGAAGWTVAERWTSNGLKPYFNDLVVHEGHAFGFDGSILACVDLADGTRKWKGGRYGHGQMVLLADQDLLLVLSEDGDLALARATPDPFTELARVPALDGKTWNHPVLVGDVLLVRNGEEMAAFRLATTSG
ncbi:MAG: PQQ-binding-like beta-propeller repeat protein [bacterium]